MNPLQPLLLASLLGFSVESAAAEQRELLQVRTSRGVTLPCLLLFHAPAPKAVSVLFPGGVGFVGLERKPIDRVLDPRGNFLVREAPLLATEDLAVVLIDCPSDAAHGMDDDFRMGERHAADIRSLILLLRERFREARVVLVGTSRGTVSAAYVAERLGTEINGLVLSSPVFHANPQHPGLSRFRFGALKPPLLLVHHAEDGCPVCSYSMARRLAGQGAALITVHSGAEPESGPCDPLSNHGFFGRETEVTQAMRDWILGRPYARDLR